MDGEIEKQTLEDHTQSPNDSASSSDSDSDSDDDESHQKELLKTLQSDLSTNPSNYEAYIQYVKLLRKMGEIEMLKDAREAMSAVFPLSPEMWQEWVQDEVSLSAGPDSFTAIEKLYERGVFDYLSVPLWCGYLSYIQEYDPTVREFLPVGISKARNLFERALTAAGLHVAEGCKIWEKYREFELAILRTIDDTDIKSKELQVQRIRSIFHRQLSIPHTNLRSTLVVYKAWEVELGNILDTGSSDVDGIPAHAALAYQKAMKMYDDRQQHEEQISRADIPEAEKFQKFMNYLKFEKAMGDPARTQVLYERAVAQFPVSSDIWLDYTHYMDRTLKVGNVVRDVHSRAVRNCPWIGELWVRYLLSLERTHAPEKEISNVFEKASHCTFSTLDEYLDLFLTRVDGLRRRISSASEGGVLDYSLIKETFKYASDYLSPHMKNTDGLVRLHAYWARLEASLGKDLVASRGVWESLLKISGSMLETWQGYIAMEIELGHINEARSIYKRCYTRRFSGTGSEDICLSWLRFEREFGTLEDFDHAAQKCTACLEELQLHKLQQESNAVAGLTESRESTAKKNVQEKRKGTSNTTDEQSQPKRQKKASQAQKKDSEKNNNNAKNLAELNEAEKVDTEFNKTDSISGKHVEASDSGRTKVYKDQCTAFISNLPLMANNEDIRKLFGDVGGVDSIRILKDKFTGKSRGLAYVDFVDDEHLAAAIAKNKQMLHGKKLSILKSNPKQNKTDGRRGPKLHAESSFQRDNNSKGRASVGVGSESVIQLKGKNTFALPRNVRPLGVAAEKKAKPIEEGDDKPKSNDEFRKMLMKE